MGATPRQDRSPRRAPANVTPGQGHTHTHTELPKPRELPEIPEGYRHTPLPTRETKSTSLRFATNPRVCHRCIPVTLNLHRRAQSKNPWVSVINPQAQDSCHFCSLIQQFHMISLKTHCPFSYFPHEFLNLGKRNRKGFRKDTLSFRNFKAAPITSSSLMLPSRPGRSDRIPA